MSSVKNIILLHGKGGLKLTGWFEHIKAFAKGKNILIISESFSEDTAEDILYKDWEQKFEEKILPNLHEDSIVVAHSLGCGLWQRYFTEHIPEFSVKTVIFASPVVSWSGIAEIKDFFTKPFLYSQIKKSSKQFFIIGGGKDKYITPEEFQFLATSLEAEYRYYPQMDHKSQSIHSQHFEVIEILKNIL